MTSRRVTRTTNRRFFAVGKVIKNVGSAKQYSVFEYSRGRFLYYFYKYVLTIVFVDSLKF